MLASSPSCAGTWASFCTVCCCLMTTTHNYASNKPLCASAWALHLACRHQDNTTINYDAMTIQPTMSLCASAWANSHHAQSHELYSASLHHTTVMTMTKAATTTCQWQGPRCKPKAFILRCSTATMTTTMAMMTTNVNNKALGTSARHFYIASRDGDDDNNYGNDDDECQQQSLVREHTVCSYLITQQQRRQQLWQWQQRMSTTRPCAQVHSIFISRCAKATMTTTIGNNEQWVSDDEALCASAQHISHCVQAHMLCIKHRCNNQPGNIKLRRAQATLSNIDNLVHKRTRLSSLVCKRTSYSTKHRCNNQPFQRQA